jgi:(p)ppGpp synthase/HD superfamily hydrolase
MEGYSELYERALRVAAIAHRDQDRKGSDVPYITHPVQVSLILLRHGFPSDVVIAGLLHDVVEDQGYPLSQIEEAFGPQVAEIVAALSEDKRDIQGNKRPWEVRKREALEHMRQAGQGVAAVKAADTLHNIRCILLDAQREGTEVWERFARGPDLMLNYYRQIAQVAREQLGEHPLVDELTDATEDLATIEL